MLEEKGMDMEIQIGQKPAFFSLGVYIGGVVWEEGSSAYRICITWAPEKINMFFVYWVSLYSSMLRAIMQMF